MNQWGVCTTVENWPIVRDAGWDFVEENVQSLLQGESPESEWLAPKRMRVVGLKPGDVPAANCLVPGHLKITGPTVDTPRLKAYMTNVMRRAGLIGMKVLVFGSAGARNVPEGFDRGRARAQILEFLRYSADLAAASNITLVAEHLNVPESNIINTIPEAMEYVRELNHPNFLCLADSWHFWLMNEKLEDLQAAMGSIRHVHLADKEGRVAPGLSGKSDYRPFFKVIKESGYAGRISVEAKFLPDLPTKAKDVLAYVKTAWAEA